MTNLDGWDLSIGASASTPAGESGGKKNFTKFPTGVTKIRILDAVPYMRWVHWMDQFSRSITCPGYGCPIDALNKSAKAQGVDAPYSMQRKWALNVYNHDTQRLEIMEEGITFMESLKMVIIDLAEEDKRLTDVVLKIRKTVGANGRATWRIDVDREEAMSVEEIGANDAKTEFIEYFKPHTVEQITQLLAVTRDFKEEFERITSNGTDEGTDENFEVGE